MAFSRTKSHMSFLVATFIVCFLLLLNKVKSSDSISFTYNNFWGEERDIMFQDDASASDGELSLTMLDEDGNPTKSSSGRALFSSPIHLWEKGTGRDASFSTSFSFIVKKASGTLADGLTFFLIPDGMSVPKGSTGRYLGIYGSDSSTHFVAVEFDTFQNEEEPAAPHIGIDINNVDSVRTVQWDTVGVPDGSIAFVEITYTADSKELSVTLSYPNVEGSNKSILSYDIDFKEHLPEWVRVGLSASTGLNVEINKILSWSFNADLSSKSEAAKIAI